MLDVLTQDDEKIGLDTEDQVDLDDFAGLHQLLLPMLLVLRLGGCDDRSPGAVQVIKIIRLPPIYGQSRQKRAKKHLTIQK